MILTPERVGLMRPFRPLKNGAKLGRRAAKRNLQRGLLPVWLFMLAIVFVGTPPRAASANQDFIAKLFADHRSTGTLIIKSQRSGRIWIHDELRSKRRYIPASTFKIANTLIALDAGVATSADQLFKWDGVIRWLNKWNQDLTLKQAFRASSVPIFQRLAKEIGAHGMKVGLAKIAYGNQNIGRAIDRFWLDGPLKISAVEQLALMEKIEAATLPFSAKHLVILKDVMIDKSGTDWTLFGKTGWTRAPTPDIGWYVGWLESGNDRFFFALNMDMTRKGQRTTRRKIVIEALRKITNLPVR